MNVEPKKQGRVAGAVAGALIGIVPVAPGLIVSGMDLLIAAGILGGITGGMLGRRYGLRVRGLSAAESAGLALRMAVLAVLIGDLLVSSAMALGALETRGFGGLVEAVVAIPALAVLGLLFFGIPALGLALVAGFVWVLVMRTVPAQWVGDPA